MVHMTLNSKTANANVVSKKIKLKEEAVMTETVTEIVIPDRPPKPEGKVTKSKPNVQDGPSIMPAKSHV